jgi:hypothetical protein
MTLWSMSGCLYCTSPTTERQTPIFLNMAYSRVSACGNVSAAKRRLIDLSLLLALAIPLDAQHGPPCSAYMSSHARQACLPRHTSTTATTTGMPSDIETRHRSFLIAAAPFHPLLPVRLSVHLVPGIARRATTNGSRERWKPYVVTHRLGLVSSFDFCTGRLWYCSHTLRAPRRRHNNVHKLGPDFHERKSNGHLEEPANIT